ncbi:DgyrCDS10300 [Dimorphilus gyrociliatus]|uniref:26S proteasome non-ATPase regulatory subunit 5 n=1 Tax=Dimorphilus gyrociliatus TaxID=2664684 RepID=A0A7I8VZR3_9ANNE|nr:DgyrCDS10300 [Dimorphilus gyrociliatus]
MNHSIFLDQLLRLLTDEETDIAVLAMENVKRIATLENGLNLLFEGQNAEKLKQVMGKNETVAFRVYETAVDVSLLSPFALDKVKYFLDQLFIVLNSGDILLIMNSFELIQKLSSTSHGISYLEGNKIFDLLCSTVYMSHLLLPGKLKTYGAILFHKPELISNNILQFFDEAFHTDELTMLITIEIICHILSTPNGKTALFTFDNFIQKIAKTLSSLIKTGPSDVRIRGMDCVCEMFEYKQDWSPKYLSYHERWFEMLGDRQFIDAVFGIVRQPFDDLHVAALRVIRSVATQEWGQKILANFPGFEEWLFDRRTETCKDGKETKFDIAHVLLTSNTLGQTFESPFIIKLKVFYKEGPFHVQSQSEVALGD